MDSRCKGDSFLAVVAERWTELDSIDLSECPSVTDEGLAVLVAGCKHLHPDKVE